MIGLMVREEEELEAMLSAADFDRDNCSSSSSSSSSQVAPAGRKNSTWLHFVSDPV